MIASVFKEAGVIEKYGSGIKRVLRLMVEAGIAAPRFEVVASCFKVTLFPVGGVSGGVTEQKESSDDTENDIEKRHRLLLQRIEKDGTLTTSQLAAILSVSRSTAMERTAKPIHG